MIRTLFALPSIICLLLSTTSFGHGTPIRVDVSDGGLIVENGVPDGFGFAPMFFADPLEDTGLSPAPGGLLLTEFPGFEIHGLSPNEGLYLEVLSRPVRDSNPHEQRLLWYWNATTEKVEVAPRGESLRVLSTRGFGEFTLAQSGTPVPAPIQIAQPLESDLGQHTHLLYYALDNDPAAAIGAYGFFARVTSPAYEPSLSFLITLNHGLDAGSLLTGAFSINAAAGDRPGRAGDFNGNGLVEQADLDLILANWGAPADPLPSGWAFDPPSGNIDQDELDRVLVGWGRRTVTASGTAVPEPSGLALVLAGISLTWLVWPRGDKP